MGGLICKVNADLSMNYNWLRRPCVIQPNFPLTVGIPGSILVICGNLLSTMPSWINTNSRRSWYTLHYVIKKVEKKDQILEKKINDVRMRGLSFNLELGLTLCIHVHILNNAPFCMMFIIVYRAYLLVTICIQIIVSVQDSLCIKV